MEPTKQGTQSDVARRLGISRQAVSKMIAHRKRTGAPKPGKNGLFDVEAFALWYLNDFKQTSGPTRGIRAEADKTSAA